MRYHHEIIERRKGGLVPGVVFINDYPMASDPNHDRLTMDTVCTDGDVIQTLDLRFVVGLKVSISSLSEVRAKALAEKCKAAGASVVAACHVQQGKPGWEQNGWAQVWKKEAAHASA